MSNSTLVTSTSSANDGNAGISTSLGMQGPGRRVWVAEVSVQERELGVPGPTVPDPTRDPVPKPVGLGRGGLMLCWVHRGLRFQVALTWWSLPRVQPCGWKAAPGGVLFDQLEFRSGPDMVRDILEAVARRLKATGQGLFYVTRW